ncbi:MAG: glycosyltransferase family A protein [Prolixibacteraceae bacterium]|jgi:glycosyltransferase involved in cell wall biosynthesis
MFSIVIPLYNKAHTILNTLNSVFAQTFQEFEIVIVNDGSTDNCINIIERSTSDPRIRIINQENKGVSAARNRGMAEAKYEYIAFLDGDDEWLPMYLEFISKTIKSNTDVGMVLCGRYSQNIQTRERINSVPKRYKNKAHIIEFFHNPHVFAHISATVVKRDLVLPRINDWGGFIEGQKSNEDFVFLFRVALHTQVAYCGYPLSIYNGEVSGQATKVLPADKKINDSILFHNAVIKEWLNTNCENNSFKIFMTYELRHLFLGKLRSKNYVEISLLIDQLNIEYKNFFYTAEWNLYKNPKWNNLLILFILITKIFWRLHRYPRVH